MKKMLLLFFLLSVSGCWRYNDDQLTKEDKKIINKLQNKNPIYYFKKTNCKVMSIQNIIFGSESIICDYAIYDISK